MQSAAFLELQLMATTKRLEADAIKTPLPSRSQPALALAMANARLQRIASRKAGGQRGRLLRAGKISAGVGRGILDDRAAIHSVAGAEHASTKHN